MNRLQAAEQLRKALQLFANTLDETQALEVAGVYPVYAVGTSYKAGEYITYGENSVGDSQLYQIVQDHTSQEDWKPDGTPSLYEPIGLNDSGYPIWARPSGAHDAYDAGDIVDYKGTLYESLMDGNVWSPEEYASAWKVYGE